MNDESIKNTILQDLTLLKYVGVNPILVHGGGNEINNMLDRLNIKPEFHEGLRVTDAETMEVVEMVLSGKINKQIVSDLNDLGCQSYRAFRKRCKPYPSKKESHQKTVLI